MALTLVAGALIILFWSTIKKLIGVIENLLSHLLGAAEKQAAKLKLLSDADFESSEREIEIKRQLKLAELDAQLAKLKGEIRD